ncbi:MAG: SufS family cysteine desulfurase [Coriobacteriaceae bacterium]|nr:SufS family cysteine desulfurase [Coriobacteriaceae bacterium]
MIDTENVTCDTCAAPGGVVDASDEASRSWPRVDIEANPYKADFPLLAGNPGIAFLDSAATAQRPAAVLEAQTRFYETMNANPLRGLYSLSVEATEAIARVRAQVARVIGAPSALDVVFTRNTSESLNLVAKSFAPTVLEPGDEIAITIMEHHSNLIPWQQAAASAGATLVYLYPTKTGELTDDEIASKVGERTKIVATTQVSNVLGVEVPVAKLGRAVHAHGGYLVVDGAQSVPHMPVDVEAIGADFFAFSAHKALGPMGIGVLWGRHELLEQMPPMLTGGEMIDSVSEQGAVWAPVPEKFEAGTQDAAGIYATGAALDYLVNQVGYEAIQAREQALVHHLMGEITQLPFVDVIGSIYWDRHHGVVSFNVRGIHPHDVASIMDMDGVCIRAGHHCAQPLLTWLGVENLACCRASVAFYNDKHDIDAFIAGLKRVWSTFNG